MVSEKPGVVFYELDGGLPWKQEMVLVMIWKQVRPWGWCRIFSHILLRLIGDPLYKVTPFYIVFNKKTQIWCGVFYNSLANDASIDLGAECDALFSMFTLHTLA